MSTSEGTNRESQRHWSVSPSHASGTPADAIPRNRTDPNSQHSGKQRRRPIGGFGGSTWRRAACDCPLTLLGARHARHRNMCGVELSGARSFFVGVFESGPLGLFFFFFI